MSIPKKIHYFWFGKSPKNEMILRSIRSWKVHLPEYQIIEWNESNYGINKNPFTKKAYSEKKWAFLSDFARLDILNQHGGIYLDTDMEVLKPLDVFLNNTMFLGMESLTHANGSIIGSVKNHRLIREMLNEYSDERDYIAIPIIITEILSRHVKISNSLQQYKDVTIYPKQYFYPFGFNETFKTSCITDETYTIHWWSHSWGSKKSLLLKKLGLLKAGLAIKKYFQ